MQCCKLSLDLVGMPEIVRVDRSHQAARGCRNSAVPRRRDSSIRLPYQLDASIFFRVLQNDLRCHIFGAVIDDDNLQLPVCLRPNATKRFFDRAGRIERRYNNRYEIGALDHAFAPKRPLDTRTTQLRTTLRAAVKLPFR
jgi:hypothetical protein